MADRNTGISRDQLRDYELLQKDLNPSGLSWQASVKDKDTTSPPGVPSTDDRYLIISGDSGTDWAGHDNDIAHYHSGQWNYYTPSEGWICWVDDENKFYYFDGSSWSEWSGSGGGASQLSDLSDVNTSTPTNRNVLVADGVDWESRALVEADISNLDKYTQSEVDNLTNIDDFTIKRTDSTLKIAGRIEHNILLNAFRIAINGSLTQLNMLDGIVDEYEDESGIDTASSTHEEYDSTNDLYSPEKEPAGIDEYTKLLLHGNGTDESKSHSITFNGTAQLDTAQYKFGESSCLFDGDSDYLTIPGYSDFDIDSTNFTIDFWVKHADHSGTEVYFIYSEDGSNFWKVNHNDGSGIGFDYYSEGSPIIETTRAGEITNTDWHHIAVCKVGNEYGVYKDGNQIAYNTSASTDTFSATLYIGSNSGTSDYFNGWMDEIRITHTNAFSASPQNDNSDTITIPTSEHISAQDTAFLAHFDGTDGATSTGDASGGDESGNNHIVSYHADAKIDQAQYKFSNSSMYFDGTGDYLSIPDSTNWDFGSGDFTVDLWIRWDSSVNQSAIIGQYPDTNRAWMILYVTGDSTLRFYYSTDGSNSNNTSWNWSPSANTWYHLAVVRSGNNCYAFVDGSQIGSTSDVTGITINDSTDDLYVGKKNQVLEESYFNGWLDEIRISKGIARWTSNFTPSSHEYASGTGTPYNMTLISDSFSAETEPDNTRIIIFEEDVDSITINTDLKAYASKDGGSTWAEITLADEGDYETSKRVLAGDVDLTQSGIGSGTNMEYKLITANNKDLKIHGTGLMWS